MSNFITVTYTETQPVPRGLVNAGRTPRLVRVDVSSMAVTTAARAGFPAYTHEGRIQLVRNFLATLGITMRGANPGEDYAPIINLKRTLANRGFTATVWVQA